MLSAILLSILMILPSTLNVIKHLVCGNNQNWLLNLNLICETLWTGARGKKWLVDFNAGKVQLVLLDRSSNTSAINAKMDGSVLEEKSFSRCWSWLSFLNWIEAITLSLLLKLPPRKSGPWFILWCFFLLRFLCICINLSFSHAWNTVVMSGLVVLVANWNCWISHKNRYAGLLVLHSLLLLNSWLIVEM